MTKNAEWDGLTAAERAEAERLDATDDALEGTEPVEVRVRKPVGKIVPLRISDEQWRTLTREAEELGLRPTTLLRMWVLERLREADRARRRSIGRSPAPSAAAGSGASP
ncbi:MAG TPA: hypothetical protein VG370_01125 [Chloroflexota bacterium]|nr:hypothetical protein [Chloroflexota bacterium]